MIFGEVPVSKKCRKTVEEAALRKRERERERQTDRQTDRQRERQRVRERERARRSQVLTVKLARAIQNHGVCPQKSIFCSAEPRNIITV